MISPKKCIENIIPYTGDERIDYDLKLNSNENIIGPSEKVVEAIKNINVKNINFYPIYNDLVAEIAKYNNTDKNMILVSNGADGAFKYIFDTYIDYGEEVLSVAPTFSMPELYASCVGAKFIKIPYEKKWKFPFENFINAINEKTKLVMLTCPNSPTGDVISTEQIEKIIQKTTNGGVVLDETYGSYYGISHVELLKKYDNLIIVKSMSKDFALAGLRLGYILSNSENIINMNKVTSPYAVNTIAAIAGLVSLQDKEHFEYVKKEVEKSKEYLKAELKPFAKTIYKSHGNFILVDFGEKAEFYYKKLLQNDIKIKLFTSGLCKNHCRITIPTQIGAKKLIDKIQPKKMIAFDMDGVLIDATNSYRKAIEETFEFFANKKTTPEAVQAVKNLGGYNNDWDLTEYLLNKEGIKPDKNLLIQKFQELYFGQNGEGFISKESLLISKEDLKLLSKNYDLAIFTGRPKKEAFFALDKFDIEQYFSVIITSDDLPVDRQKPDGLGLEKIKEIANPTQLFYLGDTTDDIKAGLSAGAISIGILPPGDKSDELKQIMIKDGAKCVLNNAGEFIKIGETL